MHYTSLSNKAFTVINYLFLLALGILCVLPMIHVLAISFSSKAPATANLVNFWPIDFTAEAYKKTLDNPRFLQALMIGIYRTVLSTVTTMLVTILTAYSLSKEKTELKGRNVIIWIFIFTMLFNGGLIPTYLIVKKVGLINSIWALVLPGAVSVYNIILLINFFRTSVPKALMEAAFIDGAGHVRTLWNVFVPLSLPAIATLTLFCIVGSWNSYFDGLIYITDPEKYPLATFLQTIVVQQNFSGSGITPDTIKQISERTVKAAQIFLGAFPVLVIYPFLQKFFIKGIVIGSVKE